MGAIVSCMADEARGLFMNWNGSELSIRQETQTPNDKGGLDIKQHPDIRLSGEAALDFVIAVLEMLPGKVNDSQTAFILGPVGADPELIGSLVATRIRELREAGG